MDNLLSARPGKQFQAPILFTEDDSMPDRGINFTMFLTMMGERLFQFDAEPELIEAFECFDENDTGMVKVKELRECLAEMGDRMTSEEVIYLFY
jgi:myosin regulatory light chain 12